MRQLSGLDASFLHMESATNYGHVGSVSVLDPTTVEGGLTFERVRDLVESRLHLLPPLRRRVVGVPFGMDHPLWVEDPDFDLDFHVRNLALPAPGDDHQLAEQVTRIAARHLDRARPLWELYLIEGLADGHVAIQIKIHHAAIDGVSGAELQGLLLDIEADAPPAPPPATPWRADRVPSERERFARGALSLILQPMKLLKFEADVARELQRRGLSGLRSDVTVFGLPDPARLPLVGRLFGDAADQPWRDVLSAPARAAPRTSFNRKVSAHRRWVFATLSLDDVKAVKNAAGVTVNDVVMAICAGALRRWLIDHEELPAEPLLAMVPVSVRTEAERGSFGNQVSAMIATLPTDEADAGARLARTNDAMRIAKEQHRAIPAELLQDFSQFATPAIAARAARLAAQLRLADRLLLPFNVVISNVPGPPFPLYFAGARLLAAYPVSTIADGVGLNITVMSYQKNLDVGLIADRDLVPDLWTLMGYFEEELGELQRAVAVP